MLRKLEQTFRCDDDCLQSGCPSHSMLLEFSTTTNTIRMSIDGKLDFFSDLNKFTMMLHLLQKIDYGGIYSKIVFEDLQSLNN